MTTACFCGTMFDGEACPMCGEPVPLPITRDVIEMMASLDRLLAEHEPSHARGKDRPR